VQNTIASAASGTDVWPEFATVNISYSNYATTMVNSATINAGAGNQTQPPQFLNIAGGDFHQGASSPTRSRHQSGRRPRRAGVRPRRPARVTVPFSGRIGTANLSRRLPIGSYRFAVRTADNAGNRSDQETIGFAVVRRRP
jgi:hypothetical protein